MPFLSGAGLVALVRVVFVGRHRVPWVLCIQYVVTLGIARRVWLYRINKEMDGHSGLALNHTLNLWLLILPIIGPTIVQAQTAGRIGRMTKGSPAKYGQPAGLYLVSWIPILGNLFFLAWSQTKLNEFWAHERQHPEHGIEVDAQLKGDRAFLVELGEAIPASYRPLSRFGAKGRARRERWAARRASLGEIEHERAIVRDAGGSTPMRFWKRPEREPNRILKITCGRCAQAFEAQRDPYTETPILCPKCGLLEVLPSLRSDTGQPAERVKVPVMKVTCLKCTTEFHAVRALAGPTRVTCFQCGRAETLGQTTGAPARSRPKRARTPSP